MVCGFWRHFLLGIVTVFVDFFSGVVTMYLVRVLGKWFLVLLQRVLDPTGVKSIIPAVCWNRVFEVLPGIQSRVL